ncbi:E3 ubiquitin-protein ligase TRIM7-like [Erythrolamprus reginae]|uniref:E3 ubiquitin-protein ligase TRIM7-like n=1 Tax=Erythrolamprus reginae TaxID=121349 RepID=UPI00396C8ADC
MDLQHIVQQLQRELTCFICSNGFLNPTTLVCGHNFCHGCLVSYWGQFPIETACPQCEEKIPRLKFIPNLLLLNITKLVEELSAEIKQTTAEGHVCKKHPSAPKAFCRNEQVLFCSMCDLSQEHLTHDVVPMAEAAQEYKGQLLKVMGTLVKEKKERSQHHTEEETHAEHLIRQIEYTRQYVVAEFNAIRQFLEEQEKFLLLKVWKNLEKGMQGKKAKHAAILFREASAFDELIQTIKEKCQKSAVELLQDAESTLNRCQQTLMNPITLPPSLKLEAWDLFDFTALLGGLMKQFRGFLASGFRIHKANVTLDPDTAHPMLILSEDLKSCWLGRKCQNLVENDKRFDQMTCVLGREMFISGRHYWDVAVENKGSWAVGVARSSVKRRGSLAFGTMEGVWVMGISYSRLWVYTNPTSFVSRTINWEINKIRVSLNYPGRRVAFCDVETGNLLCAFSATLFAGEPICPLFWLEKKTRLSLCP